ncbi:hypothetical protein D3C86_1614610 [compost metagenome]
MFRDEEVVISFFHARVGDVGELSRSFVVIAPEINRLFKVIEVEVTYDNALFFARF